MHIAADRKSNAATPKGGCIDLQYTWKSAPATDIYSEPRLLGELAFITVYQSEIPQREFGRQKQNSR